MPRDLPLGNGSLLVNFDASYQLRDLYWPHVGLENHSNGHVFRFGVWVDGRFRWLDDPGWSRRLRYADETLVTEVELSHHDLELELRCRDGVDFHQNLYLRQIDVRNPTDRHREVRFFFHHDLYISSHEVGDTAYYEPERRAVYHYKGPRWFLINTATPGKQPEDATDTVEGWHIGVHQWACGHKGVNSLQGTWKDAEDGLLSGNPIAQGSVDSTVAAHLTVPPQMTQTTYYWLAAGSTFEEVTGLNRSVRQRGPWHFINRTAAYWHLWLDTHRPDFADLPSDVSRIYLLSLLILRTQIDNGGAILAANDSDIASTVRDTYSYMWPRDGALTAHALDLAGYLDLTRPFYRFCREVASVDPRRPQRVTDPRGRNRVGHLGLVVAFSEVEGYRIHQAALPRAHHSRRRFHGVLLRSEDRVAAAILRPLGRAPGGAGLHHRHGLGGTNRRRQVRDGLRGNGLR